MPYVLHYCQEYFLGKWYFNKNEIPKNILSCESPLLREPSDTDANLPPLQQLDYGLNWYGTVVHFNGNVQLRQRQAWMLCTIIAAVNQAATFYKQSFCGNDTTTAGSPEASTTANYNKTWVFQSNFTTM
jgi:hypothetical protein